MDTDREDDNDSITPVHNNENSNTKFLVIINNMKLEIQKPLTFQKFFRSRLPALQFKFFPALQQTGLKLIFQDEPSKGDFLSTFQPKYRDRTQKMLYSMKD